jgi:hypothetical protein
MNLLKTIFAALLFLTAGSVLGQMPGVETGYLTISPENPGPNELVTARLDSYSTDLNAASISWLVNGVIVNQAKGLKTITFRAGALGAKTTVQVVATTAEGRPISKILTIQPVKVSLIYETDSYVPPFYRGKSSYSYEGRARVIALPEFVDQDGKKINPSSLIYLWKAGGQVAAGDSGYGKQIFSFRGRIPLRPNFVTVTVTNADKTLVAEGGIEIVPAAPLVLLYENNPELGVLYNKALSSNISLQKNEVWIAAAPYFFDADAKNNPNLKYDWNLNGQPVGDAADTLVLRRVGDAAGSSLLSLQVSNTRRILQFGNANLNIAFGRQTKTGGQGNPFGQFNPLGQ